MTKMTGRRFISKCRVGKSFYDDLAPPRLLFRAQEPAVDPAPHRIQQRQPILPRRLFDLLPLVAPLFALIKNPLLADVLGIALPRRALGCGALPTDFGFWHYVASGKSTLATAMAAMPSSRPMNPKSSLVVALMPTFLG